MIPNTPQQPHHKTNTLPTTHKINLFSVFKFLGIILHVPAIMAFLSILIAIISREYFAIWPLLFYSLATFLISQILYHIFSQKKLRNLKEAMIGAALGWAVCSLLGAFPYWLISNKLAFAGMQSEPIEIFSNFLNCLFESVSGFTSTGLSMTAFPSKLVHTLQWWRSLQAWIGGMGLIVFIISLIEPKKEEYRLYLAEARSDHVGKNIQITLRKTCLIYLVYTVVMIFLFYFAKMPFWASINHGLNAIATGGFSIADKNLGAYPLSAQIVALFGMTLGAVSFSMHYRIITTGKFSSLWQSLQHRIFFIFLIMGVFLTITLNYLSLEQSKISQCIFNWFSSLTTCGFSNADMALFPAAGKLLFILAMVIGGASGSTTGGLKIRRIINLFSAVTVRLKSMTKTQESEILEEIEEQDKAKKAKDYEVTDIKLPASPKSSKLYSAAILFFLWIFFLIISWILILLTESKALPIHALFDTASALSNVGLSTGLTTSALTSIGKSIFIFLMWIGRLEIIPFIILLSALLGLFKKPTKNIEK